MVPGRGGRRQRRPGRARLLGAGKKREPKKVGKDLSDAGRSGAGGGGRSKVERFRRISVERAL